MSHPRKFVIDIVASMIPIMEGSTITASLKNIKVSDIKLIGDSKKEITLTASQKDQYLTYAQMFVQMKKSSLGKHVKDMRYDIATYDPLSSFHATVTGKTYALTITNGVFNFDISSDQFPAPKQTAKHVKSFGYYTFSMDKYMRDGSKLVNGVNNKSETVIAQVD